MKLFRKLSRLIPDRIYLQIVYFKHFRRFINFNNPKTFNEKIQWLKLNYRNEEYTKLVDKYRKAIYYKTNWGRICYSNFGSLE